MPRSEQPPAAESIDELWFGGPVDAASVTLRITGHDINPLEVTRLLGCEPSEAGHSGKEVTLPPGGSCTVERGFWHLNSERQATDLATQIERLLAQLTSDLERWRVVTERYEVDVFCGLFLEDINRGFELPARLLAALGERRLRIGFDIYVS